MSTYIIIHNEQRWGTRRTYGVESNKVMIIMNDPAFARPLDFGILACSTNGAPGIYFHHDHQTIDFNFDRLRLSTPSQPRQLHKLRYSIDHTCALLPLNIYNDLTEIIAVQWLRASTKSQSIEAPTNSYYLTGCLLPHYHNLLRHNWPSQNQSSSCSYE